MMLGYLLARAGIDVYVLEKHEDFLRDFRGDTIHPSTLELMHELGILGEFLKLPHREVRRLTGLFFDITVNAVDFTALPTTCKFIALMPQWDFLDFLAARGRRYAGFHLLMKAEATELIEEQGHIVGLRGIAEGGLIDIRANLVIGADGRHSTVRKRAGLKVDDLGAPMDVLWMRISRRADDPWSTLEPLAFLSGLGYEFFHVGWLRQSAQNTFNGTVFDKIKELTGLYSHSYRKRGEGEGHITQK